MSRAAKTERNAIICKLLNKKRLSYSVIAEMTGTTRNAVSGVAFRKRHPYKSLVRSPGCRNRTKIGGGFKAASYRPKKTIHAAL